MGILRREADGFEYTLSTRTRIGRSRDNELVCTGACVSSSHCVVEWTRAGHWRVRDLGSTNGTFVAGQRLETQCNKLSRGDEVVLANASETWTLVDDTRPSAEAVSLATGERRIAEAGMLLLSDRPSSWLEVVEVDGLWVAERAGASDPVSDGQVLEFAGQAWRLRLPTGTSQTSKGDTLPRSITPRDLHLRFEVSQDLEHVRATVTSPNSTWTSDRAHHRVLLELARVRLSESTSGVYDPSERGWQYSDDLCNAVGLDSESHLNVEVHRARREMAARGIESPATIVERRRGTGKLRLGTSKVEIVEAGRQRAVRAAERMHAHG